MIINSSTVGMQSERTYKSYVSHQSFTVEMRSDEAATLQLSDEGKSYLTQLKDQVNKREEERQQAMRDNRKRSMQNMLRSMKEQQAKRVEDCKIAEPEEDPEIQMLRHLLKVLQNARKGDYRRVELEMKQFKAASQNSLKLNSNMGNVFASSSSNVELSVASAKSASVSVIDLTSNGLNATSGGGTWWTKISATDTTVTESEYTSYSAVGTARIADGREINFNVEMAMSRACISESSSFTMEEYLVTDPLVINLNSNTASVTEQKFVFDLDADGVTEDISFTGDGSGFLALDKNGDGTINDGNELFGTKSGDGFKDLAAYDQDGNGWIDEADNVFSKLKIWTKDANGNDKLISLKEAGVGAMYLGNADTKFHLNSAETNKTNGIIQKTGIFLKENGEVGTMQHVDLVV